jgi:hypothetical protein
VLYFANPCGRDNDVVATMLTGTIGYIDTPAQKNERPAGVTWCADNGAFSDKFDESDWWQFLNDNAHDAPTCLFAVAPDVVGDAAGTLVRSLPWLPKIRSLGYAVAFVGQNGQEHVPPPWDEFDVLFLGGSLECLPCSFIWPANVKPKRRQRCPTCNRVMEEWKEGHAARMFAAEAKRRGKRLHMGRVNSERRYRYARLIGCDSVDGTYLTFGPDKNLPQLLAWIRGADQHIMGDI